MSVKYQNYQYPDANEIEAYLAGKNQTPSGAAFIGTTGKRFGGLQPRSGTMPAFSRQRPKRDKNAPKKGFGRHAKGHLHGFAKDTPEFQQVSDMMHRANRQADLRQKEEWLVQGDIIRQAHNVNFNKNLRAAKGARAKKEVALAQGVSPSMKLRRQGLYFGRGLSAEARKQFAYLNPNFAKAAVQGSEFARQSMKASGKVGGHLIARNAPKAMSPAGYFALQFGRILRTIINSNSFNMANLSPEMFLNGTVVDGNQVDGINKLYATAFANGKISNDDHLSALAYRQTADRNMERALTLNQSRIRKALAGGNDLSPYDNLKNEHAINTVETRRTFFPLEIITYEQFMRL